MAVARVTKVAAARAVASHLVCAACLVCISDSARNFGCRRSGKKITTTGLVARHLVTMRVMDRFDDNK